MADRCWWCSHPVHKEPCVVSWRAMDEEGICECVRLPEESDETTPQDRLTIEGLRQTVADLRERRCDFECLICKPTASFPSNCDHIALIAWLRQKAIDAYGDLAHCERSWEDAGKEIAALKALVKEMIHHECRDGDRPFYHLWKGSEWEQEDLSILIGAMFK